MLRLLLFASLLLTTSGCQLLYYHEKGQGTFIGLGVLSNDAMNKLVVDRKSKATATGLSIGSVTGTIDDGAISAITEGVVEGVIQGIKK